MRTALAAFCLAAVVILAVIGASYLTGFARLEFGDEASDRPIAPTATDENVPPVADAPDILPAPEPESEPEPEPEPAPSPRVVVPEPPPSSSPPRKLIAAEAPEPDPAPELDPASVASAPRIVGGAGITPGPVSREEMPREAVPPAPPEPPRWTAFRRVTVVEAGRLDLGKRDVMLSGVVPPEPDRRCRLAAGSSEEPCAFLALQAMRQRIRGLGVECQIAPGDATDPATVPCRIGRTDLSLWLIGQGWAAPGEGAPSAYGEAEKRARCARKGMWLEAAPPADCPGG